MHHPHMGRAGVLDLLLERRVEAVRETQHRLLNLERKLASQPVIEQAKGVLMACTQCSPDEAFEVLC